VTLRFVSAVTVTAGRCAKETCGAAPVGLVLSAIVRPCVWEDWVGAVVFPPPRRPPTVASLAPGDPRSKKLPHAEFVLPDRSASRRIIGDAARRETPPGAGAMKTSSMVSGHTTKKRVLSQSAIAAVSKAFDRPVRPCSPNSTGTVPIENQLERNSIRVGVESSRRRRVSFAFALSAAAINLSIALRARTPVSLVSLSRVRVSKETTPKWRRPPPRMSRSRAVS
jgi:hypothetical protein